MLSQLSKARLVLQRLSRAQRPRAHLRPYTTVLSHQCRCRRSQTVQTPFFPKLHNAHPDYPPFSRTLFIPMQRTVFSVLKLDTSEIPLSSTTSLSGSLNHARKLVSDAGMCSSKPVCVAAESELGRPESGL